MFSVYIVVVAETNEFVELFFDAADVRDFLEERSFNDNPPEENYYRVIFRGYSVQHVFSR
jgi:hypothetical protein